MVSSGLQDCHHGFRVFPYFCSVTLGFSACPQLVLMTIRCLQWSQESSRYDNNGETALFKESLLVSEETFLGPCSNFPLTYHWPELHHMATLKSITGERNGITMIGQCHLLALGLKTMPFEMYDNMEEDRLLNNNSILLQGRNNCWVRQLESPTTAKVSAMWSFATFIFHSLNKCFLGAHYMLCTILSSRRTPE